MDGRGAATRRIAFFRRMVNFSNLCSRMHLAACRTHAFRSDARPVKRDRPAASQQRYGGEDPEVERAAESRPRGALSAAGDASGGLGTSDCARPSPALAGFGMRARPQLLFRRRLSHRECSYIKPRAGITPEGWPSGLRRSLGKRVYGKPYRGFESHSLRQYCYQVSDIAELVATVNFCPCRCRRLSARQTFESTDIPTSVE